jgi:hypothetical protein
MKLTYHGLSLLVSDSAVISWLVSFITTAKQRYIAFLHRLSASMIQIQMRSCTRRYPGRAVAAPSFRADAVVRRNLFSAQQVPRFPVDSVLGERVVGRQINGRA